VLVRPPLALVASRGCVGKERAVNRNLWVRQFHRWVSMIFTLAVVTVSLAFLVQEQPPEWVVLSPLLPLALLLLTGLYLFVLPYRSRWRSSRGVVREA
jgi:hypothetical protein